jgi:hypothetical protein
MVAARVRLIARKELGFRAKLIARVVLRARLIARPY